MNRHERRDLLTFILRFFIYNVGLWAIVLINLIFFAISKFLLFNNNPDNNNNNE